MAAQRISTESTVRVTGLKEAVRALKKCGDAEKLGLLKETFHQAAKLVVREAQGTAVFVSPMASRAASRLKASKVQNAAQVIFSERKGYEFGAEFGAGRNLPRSGHRGGTYYTYAGLNQFKPWLGNGTGAGYFLWPSIRAESEHIAEMVGDEMERIFEKG